MTVKTVVGLMSGTSMDGVDAAVLVTDGEAIADFGPTLFRPYADAERDVLRAAVAEAKSLTDRNARPGPLVEAEEIVTAVHSEAVTALLAKGPDRLPDLIGFHGQTVFHAPGQRLTVQIGNGRALANRLRLPVVFDFRAADVAAGGQGAPFVPVYHRALVNRAGLAGNIAVANVGGVGNITRIGADGAIAAGDTGPGNALLDDFIRERTGEAMDRDGVLADRGRADAGILEGLLSDSWFDRPLPKSLDRGDFSFAPVRPLSTEDGAATLAAFTARTLAKGIAVAGGADKVIVSGGGAHNPTILRLLADAVGAEVVTAEALGWSGDFVEAQAFAFLAARSLAGLPLSYPETTGVPRPMPGGVLVEPE
jgi:anhydro-N-acetylmuramic acid kinase